MSNIETNTDRDAKNGRFLSGCKPGPGRGVGSRNHLAQDFLRDLHDAWSTHGATALRRCAEEEPSQFCRIVSGLMPRDVAVSVSGSVEITDFAQRFRAACAMLGNPEPKRLPKLKTIEHEAADAGNTS